MCCEKIRPKLLKRLQGSWTFCKGPNVNATPYQFFEWFILRRKSKNSKYNNKEKTREIHWKRLKGPVYGPVGTRQWSEAIFFGRNLIITKRIQFGKQAVQKCNFLSWKKKFHLLTPWNYPKYELLVFGKTNEPPWLYLAKEHA